MVLYGQIVIGAPGAGKTTYCDGMQQYLKLLGRDCYVVNLDPANEVPYTNTNNDDNNNDDNSDGKIEEEDQGGNSQLPYDTILDVCQDIISLDSVMSELNLGPNGGLLYCMEYIEHHLGEVIQLLKERLGIPKDGNIQQSRAYLLFDLPGQIELTAHSNVVTRIAQRLIRELDLRLVCVQLVDGAVCLTDVSKFIGAALVCTSSMMRLELPCVNVLSKMDLLQRNSNFNIGNIKDREKSGNDSSDDDDDEHEVHNDNSLLPFNLEFFTQCHDLHRLVDYLESNPMDFMANSNNNNNSGEIDPKFDYTEDPEYQAAQARTRSSKFYSKYRKLHHELCEMVEDYSLLSFLPLSIQDAESVGRVVARIDKCNGYVFLQENGSAGSSGGQNNNNMQNMFSSAIVADSEWSTGVLQDVQEKYLGESMFREDIAELKSDQNSRIQQETDKVDESIK